MRTTWLKALSVVAALWTGALFARVPELSANHASAWTASSIVGAAHAVVRVAGVHRLDVRGPSRVAPRTFVPMVRAIAVESAESVAAHSAWARPRDAATKDRIARGYDATAPPLTAF